MSLYGINGKCQTPHVAEEALALEYNQHICIYYLQFNANLAAFYR